MNDTQPFFIVTVCTSEAMEELPRHLREPGDSAESWVGEEAQPEVLPAFRYEHFEILRREDGRPWHLGSGAMGTTYKALDTRLRHHVALKVVSADLIGHPAARERFLREARSAARLHHPNVARIFHLGQADDSSAAFYAMEYVEGETLQARVRRGGPLSVWLALELGIEVARALVAACQQDLIHRDLKPANLMLVTSAEAATVAAITDSTHGEAGEAWVKVIDFGLAKAAADAGPLTGTGEFVGTPVYASPEQIAGDAREVDGRSDIYSLGGTLWFALTGTMPFNGKTITTIQRQKLSAAPRPEQLTAVGVPAPLARLIDSMLAADPGDRPQTPSILLDALRHCRAELRQSTPVEAGRAPASFRPWSPLHRFRHRRFYQVLVGYAVGAWLVLQITAILLPNLDWPRWIMRVVIVTLLAGFGEALLLGWFLERRAEGKAWLPRSAARRSSVVLLALVPILVAATLITRQFASGSGSEKTGSVPPDPSVEANAAKSIAVLPFEDLGANQDNVFFTQGVQDEVLNDLAKVADLKVISRGSVRQYKDTKPQSLREVARTLGVAYVVEGSVQRSGNKIRVSAQLIDAHTDAQRWGGQYVRDLSDVFAIQSEIAQNIAGQLQAAISPQEHAAITELPTRDEAAYELYLRAEALWNSYDGSREAWPATLDLLRQATTRDPNFARAFVLMTEVQSCVFCYQGQSASNDALAHSYAETVARLRPGSTDARLAAGYYHYFVKHDLVRAREAFSEVAHQSPNDAQALQYLATVTRRQGNYEEALTAIRRALELDPENVSGFGIYVDTLMGLHRYAELSTVLDRHIASHPQQGHLRFSKANLYLCWRADVRAARAELAKLPAGFDPDGGTTFMRVTCDLMERDYEAAASDLAACASTEIGDRSREMLTGEIARRRGDGPAAAAAYTAARLRFEEALRVQPDDASVLMDLALTDAALGHRELALEEGRHALEKVPADDCRDLPSTTLDWARVLMRAGAREEAIGALQTIGGRPYGPDYGTLRLDPEWDPLHGDPRFQALVASVAPEP